MELHGNIMWDLLNQPLSSDVNNFQTICLLIPKAVKSTAGFNEKENSLAASPWCFRPRRSKWQVPWRFLGVFFASGFLLLATKDPYLPLGFGGPSARSPARSPARSKGIKMDGSRWLFSIRLRVLSCSPKQNEHIGLAGLHPPGKIRIKF